MVRRDEITRKSICKGAKRDVVAAVRRNGTCPSLEFLEGLSKSDAAKLYALFKRIADHALIQDGTKFKKLDGDVWEFKARGRDTGLRVTCYLIGRLVVLLTGFTKKENDAAPREVELAKSVMDEDRRLHTGLMRGSDDEH